MQALVRTLAYFSTLITNNQRGKTMKKHYQMLSDLLNKNMLNSIDVMEYAERINPMTNPYIKKQVEQRIELLWKKRCN